MSWSNRLFGMSNVATNHGVKWVLKETKFISLVHLLTLLGLLQF